MLPIFRKKQAQVGGLIVKTRTPDQAPEEKDDDMHSSGLHAAAQDIISAVEAKDAKALASAIKAIFEICDSMPGEETASDNSYDAQNALAAKKD